MAWSSLLRYGSQQSGRLRSLLRRVQVMDEDQPTVVVIDDDLATRESLGRLLRSVGLKAQLLRSVDEFLTSGRPNGPACLVLDVRLPGRSGLDYQRELTAEETRIPVIFITGHADMKMSAQAMKGGAIKFLTKPFRDQDLLDAGTRPCLARWPTSIPSPPVCGTYPNSARAAE
jgi:FixJ family two-component response regulator